MSHNHTDYSRYFSLRQKATLINMSEERDRDCFETLSGYVVGHNLSMLELHVPHYFVDSEQADSIADSSSYKLTSEALGNGIQVMADLIKIVGGNIFQLKLRGNLELFQRRSVPRIEATVKYYRFKRDLSLKYLQKEWKKVVEHLQSKGLPPVISLQDRSINICIGGFSLSMDAATTLLPISLFILDLADNLQPICVIAELVWNKQENEALNCGYRFIQILKSDQERIEHFVQKIQKEAGIEVTAKKINWELVDKMSVEN